MSDRCNLDFQFLPCAPPDLEIPAVTSGSSQTAGPETNEAQASARSHETHKSPYGTQHKDLPIELLSRFVDSFAAAFQKQYAMDFYMTKYQGKQMEALTPLFRSMTVGVHRLEEQERDEEQRAQATAAGDEEPAAKKRRIHEDLAKRVRRLTIQLASMTNRCYWLSATDVAVHLLAGSDSRRRPGTSASSPGRCQEC